MSALLLRLRAVLDRRFAAVVVLLLAVAAVGGWATYTAHVAPGTHTEERTVDAWSVEGSYTHGAAVTEAATDTAFEPGATVRNRTSYFQRVMPVLDGAFVYESDGVEVPTRVEFRHRLLVRSVGQESGDGKRTVYWQQTRDLGRSEATVQPDGRATSAFRVNVTRTIQHARNVSMRLGSPGRIQLRVRTVLTATRQRESAEPHELTFALPIEPKSTIYRVEGDPRTAEFARTETVSVPNEPGPAGVFGGPVALAVGALGVVTLIGARLRGRLAPSEAERDWLDYREDRTDFEEWITTMRLPNLDPSRPVAEAESLADLVEFAIDTDAGVIRNPDDGAYYVIHRDALYTYRPPAGPDESPGHVATETEDEAPAATNGSPDAIASDGTPDEVGHGAGLPDDVPGGE
jgi:hypothetical protein